MKMPAILEAVNNLNESELRMLNNFVIDTLRQKIRLAGAVKAAEFKVGDTVVFTKSGRGRNAGRHYVRIEGFSRDGTAIKGPECRADGTLPAFPVRWTVSANSATKVESK